MRRLILENALDKMKEKQEEEEEEEEEYEEEVKQENVIESEEIEGRSGRRKRGEGGGGGGGGGGDGREGVSGNLQKQFSRRTAPLPPAFDFLLANLALLRQGVAVQLPGTKFLFQNFFFPYF